ncbi:flagellar motor switch protein FliN [Sphingomonas sp. HMWF008]|nr:flagellar motor switch protein FliN [Sphingomonas sp. HMWF008]
MTDLKTKADPTAVPTPSVPRTINPKLIDAVEVILDGSLGKVRMTVAELTALKEGAVVRLDAPLNGLVELRLNGATVARGELVAVGSNFAVRLTEIAP